MSQSTTTKQIRTDKKTVEVKNIENEISKFKYILNEPHVLDPNEKHFASINLYNSYLKVGSYDSAWRYLYLSDTVYVWNHGGCGNAVERAVRESTIRHAKLYALTGDSLNMEKSLLKTVLISVSDQTKSEKAEALNEISSLLRLMLSHTKGKVLKKEFADAIKTSRIDPNKEDKFPQCQPYIIFKGTIMYLGTDCNSQNKAVHESNIKKTDFYKMLMGLPN